MAVTVSNSILTDRQIELTPPYRGGPTLQDHDTIGLNRTKTPVEFARVLDVLDKLSTSLRGDGSGGGPVADVVNASAAIADGNGQADEGRARRTVERVAAQCRSAARRPATSSPTIVRNVSSLLDAAADNDATLRDFGSTIKAAQPDPGRRGPRHRHHRQESSTRCSTRPARCSTPTATRSSRSCDNGDTAVTTGRPPA